MNKQLIWVHLLNVSICATIWVAHSANTFFYLCCQHQIIAPLFVIIRKDTSHYKAKKSGCLICRGSRFSSLNCHRKPFNTIVSTAVFFSITCSHLLLLVGITRKIMWMMKWNFFLQSQCELLPWSLVSTSTHLNQTGTALTYCRLILSSFWPFIIADVVVAIVCSRNVSPEITSQFADEL